MSLDQILANCKKLKTIEERSEQVEEILAGCSNPQYKSMFKQILNAFFVGNNELVDRFIDELTLEQAESLDTLLDTSMQKAQAPVLTQYTLSTQSAHAANTDEKTLSFRHKHRKRRR